MDIYKIGSKINFRIKSKNEITKILEEPKYRSEFIRACEDLENDFITNLKNLVSDGDEDSSVILNKNLDNIFNIEKGRRTQQGFYALWFFSLMLQ